MSKSALIFCFAFLFGGDLEKEREGTRQLYAVIFEPEISIPFCAF